MRYEVGRLLLIPLVSFLMAVVFLLPSCTQPPPKPAEQTIIWDHAGSWSGRGDLETNSFPASSGYLRFTWETSNETKPGEGRFKLILGSSISGRRSRWWWTARARVATSRTSARKRVRFTSRWSRQTKTGSSPWTKVFRPQSNPSTKHQAEANGNLGGRPPLVRKLGLPSAGPLFWYTFYT